MAWSPTIPTPRVRRYGRAWWAKFYVRTAGIVSAEAFGTPVIGIDQVIAPAGIATREAFGATVVLYEQIVLPAGLASAEAFGAALVAPGDVNLAPAGIASLEAFGAPAASAVADITPAGITTGEAFGAAAVIPGDVDISPAGITSGEAFGTMTANLAGEQTLTGIGITSAEAFGTAVVDATADMSPAGIASAEAFGAATVLAIADLAPTGITTGEAFGAATLTTTADLAPAGIASAEAFGAATVDATADISPTGITTGEAFGAATVDATADLAPTGIATGEAFGTAVVDQPGGVLDIAPTGIASAEAFGDTIVGRGAGVVRIATSTGQRVTTATATDPINAPANGSESYALTAVVISVSSNSTSTTCAVTYGGVAMVQDYFLAYGNSSNRAAIGVYRLQNPPTGPQNVVVTPGGTSTKAQIATSTEVYQGVLSVGAEVTAAALAVSVASQASGKVWAVAANGAAITTPTQNSLFLSGGAPGGVGDYISVQDADGTGANISLSNSGTATSPQSAGVALAPAYLPQTVTPTGIASGEAFGTAAVENVDKTITATGIASAEAFGTAVVVIPFSQTVDVANYSILSPSNLARDPDGAVAALWGTELGANAAVSTEQAYTGTTSVKVTKTLNPGWSSVFLTRPATRIPVVAGQVITSSLQVQRHAANVGGPTAPNSTYIQHAFYDSTGTNAMTYVNSPVITAPSGSWAPLSVSTVVPAGYDGVDVQFGMYYDDPVGTVFYIDAMQIDASMGQPTVTKFFDPISSLVDPFTTKNTTLWNWAGTADVANGQLKIPLNTAWDSLIRSPKHYSLLGSTAKIELVSPTISTGDAGVGTYCQITSMADTNDHLQLWWWMGTLILRYTVDGVGNDVTLDGSVGGTNMPNGYVWFQVSEAAGTINIDTSVDGVTWVNRRSFANPGIDLSEVDVFVGGGSSTLNTLGSAIWDNFNVTASYTPTSESNTPRTNQAPPAGDWSGAWVLINGGGGGGGNGATGSGLDTGGGGGGGGGGKVEWTWIPRAYFGATYSMVVAAAAGAATNGNTSQFSTGSVVVTANGGAKGANGALSNATNAAGGAGGTASVTGGQFHGTSLATGGAGGAGGKGQQSTGGDASIGGAPTGNAGAGGGGGGGMGGVNFGTPGQGKAGANSSTATGGATGRPGATGGNGTAGDLGGGGGGGGNNLSGSNDGGAGGNGGAPAGGGGGGSGAAASGKAGGAGAAGATYVSFN